MLSDILLNILLSQFGQEIQDQLSKTNYFYLVPFFISVYNPLKGTSVVITN